MNCFHSKDVQPFYPGDVVRCHWYQFDMRGYVVHSCERSTITASGWEVRIEEKREGGDSFLAKNTLCAGWFVRADGTRTGRNDQTRGAGEGGSSGGGRAFAILPSNAGATVGEKPQERKNKGSRSGHAKNRDSGHAVGNSRRYQK